MDVIIVGAGPTGLTVGASLARRGHHVVAVDRDPGPAGDGSWRRRGVMQFAHPHGFRPQVCDLLLSEWPEAWQAWVDLGAEPFELPGPGRSQPPISVRSRRVTYERALRHAAAGVGGLTVAVGQVDGLVESHGRVVGAVVDGATVESDLVIDATGRLTRLSEWDAVELGADTGMAYVTRTYRRQGALPEPMVGPAAWVGVFDGYQAYVFAHEARHFSVVIIRPTADAELTALRHADAFDAACRAIPGLCEWTDPALAVPTSQVMVGGRLRNTYRRQAGRPGLVAVGDSVATTAPTAGRGLAMASMQIERLLQLLDEGAEPTTVNVPFGAWCEALIKPWVQDHVDFDGEAVRLWRGEDVDLSRPLTSAAIVAAAQAEPAIWPYLGGFLAMTALPESLAPAEPLARALYQSGWRMPMSEGPSRDELVDLVRRSTAVSA